MIIKKIFLTIFILLLVCINAFSQDFWDYAHPELEWFSFDTKNFTIHYHEGTKRTALLIARIAEDIHPHVTDLYQYVPAERTHFVIKDTDDYSNGGAFFFDNKIEIFTSNLDYVMRGTRNWLRDVVTHEYAHMISIMKMIKTNTRFPYAFFQVFGYEKERRKDVVRGFPNTLISYPLSSINLPVWFAEGTAQHQADSSRYDYRDPHREMILRDRLLYDQLLTFNEMGVFGKNSHGNESAYNLGFSFVNYLTDRFGEALLPTICEKSSDWNTYTFNSVIKNVTGEKPKQLYLDWKDSLLTTYNNRLSTIKQNLVMGKTIEPKGFANLYPVWSPDGNSIAYVSNRGKDYFSQNALVIYDRKSGESKKVKLGISSSLSWSPDGKYIVYSRHNFNYKGSSFTDLYLFNVETKKETRLTYGLRGRNPDFNSDGSQLVFVTENNGLFQLNLYYLPENPEDTAVKDKVYINKENGKLQSQPSDSGFTREVIFKAGKIEQLLAFNISRQIFHPRWADQDRQIIFDSAIEYGRNLGAYDLEKSEFKLLLEEEEELRYPWTSPDSPWLYYAASSTGIYNIYRYNLEDGEKELLTNVTGGAFMPSVNKNGEMVYALYDSLGYKIAVIDNPNALDKNLAVYNPDYIASIPDKNFKDDIIPEYKSKKYKSVFSGVHFLPRVLVDYSTVKFGSYLYSADVLDKMNLFAGAAVNSKFDYDLYGSVEYREIWPMVFLEIFNMSANISDTANVIRSNEGDKRFVQLKQDINFDLTEARLGIRGSIPKIWSWKLEYIFSYYNAKVNTEEKLDPIENVLYGGTVRYPYLIGHALQWSIIADAIAGGMHKDINPSGGFYLNIKHALENNRLIEGFKTDEGEIKKVYNSYKYNRFELQAEYFIKNPLLKSHAFSIRFMGGYIDKKVDDFFDFFAGGLLGMKGYSFYSIEGRQKLITTLTYRMPILNHIDRRIGHVYLDKLYFGIYYDYGHAWNQESIPWKSFQRDIGFQLRLETFSYHLFPTRLFAEAAYPLDEVTNVNTFYKKEWRYYFGALFEYDFRERLGTLTKLNPMRIFK